MRCPVGPNPRGNVVTSLLDNAAGLLETANDSRLPLRERIAAVVELKSACERLGVEVFDPDDTCGSARSRIQRYLRLHVGEFIDRRELAAVAGISEWARRVRELRTQAGFLIVTGEEAKRLADDGEWSDELPSPEDAKVHHYLLLDAVPDREAAYRWKRANELRKDPRGVRARMLDYLLDFVGRPVPGDELQYIANGATEWARRLRELRTEHGWSVTTRNTGRPDLPVGVYLLESRTQLPEHDRRIPDPVRVAVLKRDGFTCQARGCGWKQEELREGDPRRRLELHHKIAHGDGGANSGENLITLCNVCHDDVHRTNPTSAMVYE